MNTELEKIHTGLEIIQSLGKNVQKSIVPLYKDNSDTGIPEFIGSSIYFHVGPVFLLVTATHVLENIGSNLILYPNSNELILALPCSRSDIHKSLRNDISIILLSDNLGMWEALPSTIFVPFSSEKWMQYILCGYPASSSRGSTENKQKLRFETYVSGPSDEEVYRRLGIDRNKELAIEFKKENVFGVNLEKKVFSDPNGMSGGPVIQFDERNAARWNIIGIITRIDKQKKKAIIATRIEVLNSMVSFQRIDIKK